MVERVTCWDEYCIDSDPDGAFVYFDEYEEVENLLRECYNRIKTEYDPVDAELLARIEKTLEIKDE